MADSHQQGKGGGATTARTRTSVQRGAEPNTPTKGVGALNSGGGLLGALTSGPVVQQQRASTGQPARGVVQRDEDETPAQEPTPVDATGEAAEGEETSESATESDPAAESDEEPAGETVWRCEYSGQEAVEQARQRWGERLLGERPEGARLLIELTTTAEELRLHIEAAGLHLDGPQEHDETFQLASLGALSLAEGSPGVGFVERQEGTFLRIAMGESFSEYRVDHLLVAESVAAAMTAPDEAQVLTGPVNIWMGQGVPVPEGEAVGPPITLDQIPEPLRNAMPYNSAELSLYWDDRKLDVYVRGVGDDHGHRAARVFVDVGELLDNIAGAWEAVCEAVARFLRLFRGGDFHWPDWPDWLQFSGGKFSFRFLGDLLRRLLAGLSLDWLPSLEWFSFDLDLLGQLGRFLIDGLSGLIPSGFGFGLPNLSIFFGSLPSLDLSLPHIAWPFGGGGFDLSWLTRLLGNIALPDLSGLAEIFLGFIDNLTLALRLRFSIEFPGFPGLPELGIDINLEGLLRWLEGLLPSFRFGRSRLQMGDVRDWVGLDGTNVVIYVEGNGQQEDLAHRDTVTLNVLPALLNFDPSYVEMVAADIQLGEDVEEENPSVHFTVAREARPEGGQLGEDIENVELAVEVARVLGLAGEDGDGDHVDVAFFREGSALTLFAAAPAAEQGKRLTIDADGLITRIVSLVRARFPRSSRPPGRLRQALADRLAWEVPPGGSESRACLVVYPFGRIEELVAEEGASDGEAPVQRSEDGSAAAPEGATQDEQQQWVAFDPRLIARGLLAGQGLEAFVPSAFALSFGAFSLSVHTDERDARAQPQGSTTTGQDVATEETSAGAATEGAATEGAATAGAAMPSAQGIEFAGDEMPSLVVELLDLLNVSRPVRVVIDVEGAVLTRPEGDSYLARADVSAERDNGRWDNLTLELDVSWLVQRLTPREGSGRRIGFEEGRLVVRLGEETAAEEAQQRGRRIDIDLEAGWTMRQLVEIILNADRLVEQPGLLIPDRFSLRIAKPGRLALTLAATVGVANLDGAVSIEDDLDIFTELIEGLDSELLANAAIYLRVSPDLEGFVTHFAEVLTGDEMLVLGELLVVIDGHRGPQARTLSGQLEVAGDLAVRLLRLLPYVGAWLRVIDMVQHIDDLPAYVEAFGIVLEELIEGRDITEEDLRRGLMQSVLGGDDIRGQLDLRRMREAIEAYCQAHPESPLIDFEGRSIAADDVRDLEPEQLAVLVGQMDELARMTQADPELARWLEETGVEPSLMARNAELVRLAYERAAATPEPRAANLPTDLDADGAGRLVDGILDVGGGRGESQPLPEYVPFGLPAPSDWRERDDGWLIEGVRSAAFNPEARMLFYQELLLRHPEVLSERAPSIEAMLGSIDRLEEALAGAGAEAEESLSVLEQLGERGVTVPALLTEYPILTVEGGEVWLNTDFSARGLPFRGEEGRELRFPSWELDHVEDVAGGGLRVYSGLLEMTIVDAADGRVLGRDWAVVRLAASDSGEVEPLTPAPLPDPAAAAAYRTDLGSLRDFAWEQAGWRFRVLEEIDQEEGGAIRCSIEIQGGPAGSSIVFALAEGGLQSAGVGEVAEVLIEIGTEATSSH